MEKVDDSQDFIEEQDDVDDELSEKEQEDLEAKQNENTSNVEQIEQEAHRHEAESYVIMLAMAVPVKPGNQDIRKVIRDASREVLTQLETQLTERLGGSAVASIVVRPANHEEEVACESVASALIATSENVKDDLLSCTSEDERESLAKAVMESTISTGATVDVQRLTERFDNALTKLFQVPVADQSPQQLTETFISLALFAVEVIRNCESCLEDPSVTQITQNVVAVGMVIYKVADKHGLSSWVQDNGGWRGLCTRIRNCIRQLTRRLIPGNTSTDDHNTVSIPWPSNNTIILFGSLTVFFISYAYVYYKYR